MPKFVPEFPANACRVIIIALVFFSAISEAVAESQIGAGVCTPMVAASENPYSDWDWVPAEQLNGTACLLGPGCDGAYIEPPRDWLDAELKPEGAPIRVTAGASEMLEDNIFLAGEVFITQGDTSARANQAQLDRRTDILTLNGDVELRQPGLLIRSEHAVINTETQLGQFENTRLLDFDSGTRSTAVLADRVGEYQLDLQSASYTLCSPAEETWSLKAADIHLDYETGLGTATHARINIQDVPVFYTPWISFPIDERRMSGFLWPTLGESSNSGFEVAVPYYLNIAPNFDMTVAPHYLADRGTMTEAEARYLNQYGWLTLSGGYLDDDNKTGENRWIKDARHRGRYGSNWSSYLNYTKVSDDDYFDDFELASLEVKRATHLDQNIGIVYASPNWQAEIEAADYQTIDPLVQEPYQRLPQITVYNSAGGANFAPDLLFLTELTRFDHTNSFDQGGSRVTGDRAYLEGGLSFPMNWSAGFIVPTAKVRHLSYQLEEGLATQEDDINTTVPLATLDMGLVFERSIQLGKTAYTQTLEPRIYYFYSEYKNQEDNPNFDSGRLTFSYNQLYRDTRFSGHDRLDDANQVSVGLTSRFLRDGDGREALSMSIGQIYYFEDREVELNYNLPVSENDESNSEIAGELMYQPADNLWLSSTAVWDSIENNMNQAGASFHYVSSSQAVYNLSYRFDRDRILDPDSNNLLRNLEQLDLSVAQPVGDRWKLFARYQYDLDGDFSLETMAGVQYESCCWLTRFVYQRAVLNENLNNGSLEQDYDNTFLLEFQLKGLGSIGNRVQSLLQESILGYDDDY